MALSKISALIGVRYDHGRTYYVKRSSRMENYPNVWSLFSIQYRPEELQPEDTTQVQNQMENMSEERLGGVPIKVLGYLNSGECSNNPIKKHVLLHTYMIYLPEEPELNPDFYADSAWLTPEDYMRKAEEAPCGLCTRLWSDYAYSHGLCSSRFAPIPEKVNLLLRDRMVSHG